MFDILVLLAVLTLVLVCAGRLVSRFIAANERIDTLLRDFDHDHPRVEP